MLKPDFPKKGMEKEKWKEEKGRNGKKEKEKDEQNKQHRTCMDETKTCVTINKCKEKTQNRKKAKQNGRRQQMCIKWKAG